MRKVLILAAALALCATPALAQQKTEAAGSALSGAAVQAPAAALADAPEPQKPAPSLYVSTEEVRRQVRAAEAGREEKAQIGSQSWLYLVAAIAIGVLVVLLITD
ncbi:MAG TPA: hypothetical protein VFR81_19960 [Longimicrobium sp.]|nr:hypothetical protein [Longimicrobium sp.]